MHHENDARERGTDGIPLIWEIGDVILDRYEVVLLSSQKPYAEGGFGRVHRVWDRERQLDLAVKSIHPDLSWNSKVVEDFKREAEVWATRIGSHPNIVTCHQVFVLGDLPRVFVEFVAGGSLHEWIRTGKLYEGGPVQALRRILDILTQLAHALHHTHEQGLIHQDVKPANVLLDLTGIAKLTDFGLASVGFRAIGIGEAPVDMTLLGTLGGMTGTYCSPEQAEIFQVKWAGLHKHQPGHLTRRTDVWSWAVTALEMFQGEASWPSGSVADRYLKRTVENPCLPRMPATLVDLLACCFQRRPEDRPHDLGLVIKTLQEIHPNESEVSPPREPPSIGTDQCQPQVDPEPTAPSGPATPIPEKVQGEICSGDWRGLLQSPEYMPPQMQEGFQVAAAPHGDRYREEVPTTATHFEISPLPFQPGFERHAHVVASVSLSGDSRMALSGSWDKTLKLWEVTAGRCLHTFNGHSAEVTSVCLGRDGQLALSGSLDKTLRLWSVSATHCLGIWKGHQGGICAVTLSSDSSLALSGGWDRNLKLWEVSTGRCLRDFKGHHDVVSSVSLSRDGRLALSGSWDATLRLWEVSTGQCLRIFEGHDLPVSTVFLGSDNQVAVSGSWGGALRVWNVSSGCCLATFKGHTAGVTSSGLSEDSKFALSGSWDGTLKLWKISSGCCLGVTAHQRRMARIYSGCLSSDNRLILSGCADGSLKMWRSNLD